MLKLIILLFSILFSGTFSSQQITATIPGPKPTKSYEAYNGSKNLTVASFWRYIGRLKGIMSHRGVLLPGASAEAFAAEDDPAAALARRLSHENPAVREEIARALGEMGARASGAVSALEAAIARENHARVQEEMEAALKKIAPEKGAAEAEDLDRWVAALSDPEAETRIQAAMALGAMGERAAPAKRHLRQLLADPDDRVAEAAAMALRLVPDPDPLAEKLAGMDWGELGQYIEVNPQDLEIGTRLTRELVGGVEKTRVANFKGRLLIELSPFDRQQFLLLPPASWVDFVGTGYRSLITMDGVPKVGLQGLQDDGRDPGWRGEPGQVSGFFRLPTDPEVIKKVKAIRVVRQEQLQWKW